jgi:hypothetical protein
LAAVTVKRFSYASPKLSRFRPDRRTADYNDLAERLKTFLHFAAGEYDGLVLVAHSQGGLIVQRYLARMLNDGQGEALSKIRRVMLFACPNDGSDFMLSLRDAWWRKHPQVRALKPFDSSVKDAQRVVFRQIVNATEVGPSSCHIPFSVFGGSEDNIVVRASAQGVFPDVFMLPGDHFSIIQPDSLSDDSYVALRSHLREFHTGTVRPIEAATGQPAEVESPPSITATSTPSGSGREESAEADTYLRTKLEATSAREQQLRHTLDLLRESGSLLIDVPLGGLGRPTALAFTPSLDQLQLAIGTDQGKVRLWDCHGQRFIGRHQPFNHPAEITQLAYSPDGRLLATADSDGTIRLWNVTTLELMGSPLTAQQAPVTSLVFSHDGTLLASGGHDGTVRLWDTTTVYAKSTPLTSTTNAAVCVGFTSDGILRAAALDAEGLVWLWDPTTDKGTGDPIARTLGGAGSLMFSPDGTGLAIGDLEKTQIWDTTKRRAALTIKARGSATTFSIDAPLLALSNHHGPVALARTTDETIIDTLIPPKFGTRAMTFSRHNTYLALTDHLNVRLWPLAGLR